jgi:hypothetical protein
MRTAYLNILSLLSAQWTVTLPLQILFRGLDQKYMYTLVKRRQLPIAFQNGRGLSQILLI